MKPDRIPPAPRSGVQQRQHVGAGHVDVFPSTVDPGVRLVSANRGLGAQQHPCPIDERTQPGDGLPHRGRHRRRGHPHPAQHVQRVRGRTNGRYCAPRRYTIRACARPILQPAVHPSGASAQVTSPHRSHSSDSTTYSVTCGRTRAGISITYRRCRANTLAPARSPAQPPQLPRRHDTRSSGPSTSIFVAPRGLPRLPRPGMERRSRPRPSDDGGFELFDESIPNRARNSATSTRSPPAAKCSSSSGGRGRSRPTPASPVRPSTRRAPRPVP